MKYAIVALMLMIGGCRAIGTIMQGPLEGMRAANGQPSQQVVTCVTNAECPLGPGRVCVKNRYEAVGVCANR